MRPWIDRQTLITQAKDFVKRNGSFLRSYANRISSLVEIAVYTSIVGYYEQRGFLLGAKNLGPRSSFRFKISSTGHAKNFSYFEAKDPNSGAITCIFHNTKIQSAHNGHLYYTPDVAVCSDGGNVTQPLKSGRRHSYISNGSLLSFVEVKHLPPFPEALFSFTGLVQEFQPWFISKDVEFDGGEVPLAPVLVFTGVPSEHCEKIKVELTARYGINIVYGTQKSDGRIAEFSGLRKYRKLGTSSGAGASPVSD